MSSAPLAILASATRASPMSRSRVFGSRSRQRAQQLPDRWRRAAGHGAPIGLARQDGGDDVGHGVAGKRGAAREHFVKHNAERPDVGAPVNGLAPGLLGGHVGRRAENHAGRRDVAPSWSASWRHPAAGPAAARSAFANPKSSTFTVPSARTLMLAGFRSRWTTPASCAPSSAAAICARWAALRPAGSGPRAMLRREIIALDQLHHEGRHVGGFSKPVNGGDVRMIQRRERLGFAREPLHTVRDRGRSASGRILSATSRPSLVSRARDQTSPIPPAPSGRKDFVGSKAGAGRKGQVRGSYGSISSGGGAIANGSPCRARVQQIRTETR